MAMTRKHGLPAALLCACLASPAPAAILPTDLEAKVGAGYEPVDANERGIWENLERLEALVRASPQRLIAPELDAYTRGVVERLIGRPAPDLRIYLMRDATFNAAMFPTGMMLVNTGVLARVRTEAEFAAVLGHEAGHYFRKHYLERDRETREKSAAIEAVNSAARSAYYGYYVSYSGAVVHAVTSIFRFSRNQESEADAYGLMLMARAGYSPRPASAVWEQLIDERRASAAARGRRYRGEAGSALSTHPPTERRIADLNDTADSLAGKRGLPATGSRDTWASVIRPYQAMLLQEQVYLNDPGASLYLLENLAQDGWSGLLRFNEGEIYRLRGADGDESKAAAAYAAATALADAPPEAWRAHGYAQLKAGNEAAGYGALHRYLSMQPDAADAALIRFTTARQPVTPAPAQVAGGRMIVSPASTWSRLAAVTDQARWKEMWTRNGSQLDRIALLDGLPEGKSLAFQKVSADQQVPVFRADMTALDLVSMLEVSYRIHGVTAFHFESVEPVDFLGGPGIRLSYRYASGIGFTKRGSCVLRVVAKKLYAMRLEGVAGQSFDAVAPEFDQLAASAQLRR